MKDLLVLWDWGSEKSRSLAAGFSWGTGCLLSVDIKNIIVQIDLSGIGINCRLDRIAKNL